MKHGTSLEEEKRQLLAQLESSRAVYRRMLTDSDRHSSFDTRHATHSRQLAIRTGKFPQNRAMRWVASHPYLTLAAVAAVFAIGPRRIMRTITNRPSPGKHSPPKNAETKNLAAKGIAATLGTSLVTAAAMMLRNPARLRTTMQAVQVAVNYLKSRRSRY